MLEIMVIQQNKLINAMAEVIRHERVTLRKLRKEKDMMLKNRIVKQEKDIIELKSLFEAKCAEAYVIY